MSFSFFNLSKELSNYFKALQSSERDYSYEEVNKLISRYDFIDHSTTPAVMDLLKATRAFLSETDPDFKEVRKTKKDSELLKTITKIEAAIITAEAKRDQLQGDTVSHPVMVDALQYCTQAVSHRIEVLKKADKQFYKLCTADAKNGLRTFIKQHGSPRLA